MAQKTSRISGFYKLTQEERLKIVAEFSELSEEEVELIRKSKIKDLNKLIENVIGSFELPLAIATNFLIDGKDYLIPMVIEEPSVVAAASNAARIARIKGGFHTYYTGSIMIGQIQVITSNPYSAKFEVLRHKDEIIAKANEVKSTIIKLGGGCKDVNARVISKDMLIVDLHIDVKDAMGANFINTVCEHVAPFIEKITGGKVLLRILSNLSPYRLAIAKAIFDKDAVGGKEVVENIIKAYEFAKVDIFRRATHIKGIMNGVCAVLIATGNDFRAVESDVYTYVAMNNTTLTHYEINENGDLVGYIELPISVGTVGGTIKANPLAEICLKILGIKSAEELARIIAAVGLAQNFAALRALVTEGIQRGHMELHAKNLALAVGAKGDEVDKIAEKMVKEGNVSMSRAKELLEELRKHNK
ncbi:MAG TPA: hydroxymethylglutaryl-CoA reductase, degradative [Archaeoglobus profundus]|nr:hydroxymethylglutaryl-CoA reductase, degradative [Archaeoglobus profundus]